MKKSCRYGEYGLVEPLLFFFCDCANEKICDVFFCDDQFKQTVCRIDNGHCAVCE